MLDDSVFKTASMLKGGRVGASACGSGDCDGDFAWLAGSRELFDRQSLSWDRVRWVLRAGGGPQEVSIP